MIRPYAPFTYSLSAAAELLGAELVNEAEISFTGLTHKDSEIQPGDIFFAFPGARVHGAEFIAKAKQAGAVAVLTDSEGAKLSTELPTLVVSHPREAGATLAASFYRAPIRDMQSIGITGTNGKTTVTTLLFQIFEKVGRESGLIGTVETRIGSEVIKSDRTTPEAADLQALAATMRERHMRHLVMEVSSHSLDLKRMVGSHFAIVGFTNLTQDHLDYHKDMESYFQAKSRLFTHEYADLGFINIDDAYGLHLFEISEIANISLSRLNVKATWHFTSITPTTDGYEFTVRGKDGVLIESCTPMHGGYNLDNLLLAVAIAYECGIDPLELATILPQIAGAPGRLEAVSLGQNFTALVDYAHSPDAVSNVLSAVREFTTGRIIAVLGCGGDRDASKRPLMGEALYQGSDIAVFTSDNPRSESAVEILNQMVGAINVSEDSRVIEDRAAAITYAVSLAQPGDSVIILGKGHEVGQEIKGVVTPFDDRLQLAQAIEARP
ncbi:MurE UDP-N-acetylmuramyl tripeptide synthase [Candidatus Nanopelagicaceae bacterium]